MSQITAHVLDTSKGKPAQGIAVVLYVQKAGEWQETASGTTNKDGRLTDLLDNSIVLAEGIYKMRFLTRLYFDRSGTATLYPYVDIVFELSGSEHYHIPLLLSAFGYTTYRGS